MYFEITEIKQIIMKTIKSFLMVALFLYLPLILYSQEIGIRSLPIELLSETKVIQKMPLKNGGYYAKLPSSFTNLNISSNIYPQNEPSVKFNAKDPRYVLAAWRDFRQSVSPPIWGVGYSYSNDSGKTFASNSVLIPVLNPAYPYMSDPVVCSDTNGNFYIATLSFGNSGGMDVVVYKSTDNGITFADYKMAAGGIPGVVEDKEWMVCDLTKGNSPYKNNLYITWTRYGSSQNIQLTKSTNNGVNWTPPVKVSGSSLVQGSCPAIGPGGEVYVVWIDYMTSDFIVYFNKSTDGGSSFEAERVLTQGIKPNIDITSNGFTMPSMAADISGGPRNGNIYITFSDGRNGDADVFFMKSSNGGDNWSTPVRVNDDSLGNGKLQCWPWIAVNEYGEIAIVFYDSRNGNSNSIVSAWLARSTNGGQSFVNEALSSVSFQVGWPNPQVRFGDYINVDYRGGRIVPVWTDLREGGVDMEIYTASVYVPIGVGNISSGTPKDYILHQNYPNPFNSKSKIKFEIPKSSDVRLLVFDITGKEIAAIVDEPLNSGTYDVTFDGNSLSSGVYFYRLITDNYSETKKMMLIK